MKSSVSLILSGAYLASATLLGQDVSNYQGSIDWSAQVAAGSTFAIIKATEGTTYTSPSFSSQYDGATDAGLVRGGYHFAHPDSSSGAAQAKFFLDNGGGWTGDGQTLPGMLDIEYNPNGATCYGLSTASMVSWISDFVSTYKSSTGRSPMIYSTLDWWTTCTGNSAEFSDCPLVIARYGSTAGTVPASWTYWTFWQNADSGTLEGDQDMFNGDSTQLTRFATG